VAVGVKLLTRQEGIFLWSPSKMHKMGSLVGLRKAIFEAPLMMLYMLSLMLMEHIQGFTWSQWMLPLVKSRAISPQQRPWSLNQSKHKLVCWRNRCELPWFLQESSVSWYWCVTFAYVINYKEFLTHDLRGFTIFKEWLAKSVGPVPFSAKYLICRHVQTHGLTDGLTN